MDTKMFTNAPKHFKISPTDKDKKPREVLTPVWAIDSGEGTITPDADNLGATYTSGDNAGTAVVSVKAKPDLTGVSSDELVETANITIEAAAATALNLTADEQPA